MVTVVKNDMVGLFLPNPIINCKERDLFDLENKITIEVTRHLVILQYFVLADPPFHFPTQ